jgi:hypothetical protein
LISLRGGFCGVGNEKFGKFLSGIVGSTMLEAAEVITIILKLHIIAASALKSNCLVLFSYVLVKIDLLFVIR